MTSRNRKNVDTTISFAYAESRGFGYVLADGLPHMVEAGDRLFKPGVGIVTFVECRNGSIITR